MRSQVERDDVTVTILTALAMLVGVSIVGAGAVGLLAWFAGLPDLVVAVLACGVSAPAIWISGVYLWRHRRP